MTISNKQFEDVTADLNNCGKILENVLTFTKYQRLNQLIEKKDWRINNDQLQLWTGQKDLFSINNKSQTKHEFTFVTTAF